jgi:hypothetical protein
LSSGIGNIQGGRGWACPWGGRRKNHGRADRRLVTAAGDVTLSRAYFTCRACGQHAHARDDRLGLDGFVSPHAQRLLCTLGADWSFERCARHLRDVAGLCVCDNMVRKVCDRHGGRMRAWQREDPEAARPFRAATGAVEFQTDGTCVNTTGGWREVRLSIFAKRRRGEPITDLDDWDDQRLPAPHARVATAAIRTSEALGPQWRRAAGRLGIKRTDAAMARHGAGPAAEAWYADRRRTLLESGASGLLTALAAERVDVSELVGYLEPHRDHTPYRERLAEGRSIGSGMVEGACKTAIGRRLKQTGARWKVRRLARMAVCCSEYSNLFEAYWKKAAG